MGNWKLLFRRGAGANPEDRTIADAAMCNLAEDPAEEKDLSESNPEKKKLLFAGFKKYFAGRKLKPLALQVFEDLQNKK